MITISCYARNNDKTDAEQSINRIRRPDTLNTVINLYARLKIRSWRANISIIFTRRVCHPKSIQAGRHPGRAPRTSFGLIGRREKFYPENVLAAGATAASSRRRSRRVAVSFLARIYYYKVSGRDPFEI